MTPDLSQHLGETDGSLNKFSVKCDGEDAYTYTVDVVFPILNSKEAEALEPFFPGAKQTYVSCTEQDDWKEQRTVTPVFPSDLNIELAAKKSGRSLIKAVASIPRLLLRASKKVVTLTVRLVFTGQAEGIATGLTHGMKSPITFCWEQAQQSLFVKKTVATAITPKVGQIVCFAEADRPSHFGQVVEIHEDNTALVSDFGEEDQVRFQDLRSAWTVNTEDPEYDTCLKSYKERCKRRNLTASWSALTQAVGEAFGQEGTPGEGAHTLTKPILSRAIAILEATKTGPKLELVQENPEPSEAAGMA